MTGAGLRRARALLLVVSKRLETAELNFKAARLRVARQIDVDVTPVR